MRFEYQYMKKENKNYNNFKSDNIFDYNKKSIHAHNYIISCDLCPIKRDVRNARMRRAFKSP